MSRFTRIQVYNKIRDAGIVPIFYHKDLDTCMRVLRACYAGGSRVFEFTNRGDQADATFKMIVTTSAEEMPDLILGAGSVVDGPTASLYIQLGADFIVSPVMVEEMARICNRRKIAWIPGTGSATEISNAEMLGAEIIKIFPAQSVGGPEYIKSVLGPMPWTHLMPTGGVKPEEENIKSWLMAGAFCLGMGSQLMVKDKNGNYDYPAIESLTKKSIEWARKYNKW